MAFLIPYNTLLLRNLTRFLFFLYFIPLSFAQNVYQGEINFNYSGTVDGSFTSISGDSLITGLTINQQQLLITCNTNITTCLSVV